MLQKVPRGRAFKQATSWGGFAVSMQTNLRGSLVHLFLPNSNGIRHSRQHLNNKGFSCQGLQSRSRSVTHAGALSSSLCPTGMHSSTVWAGRALRKCMAVSRKMHCWPCARVQAGQGAVGIRVQENDVSGCAEFMRGA